MTDNKKAIADQLRKAMEIYSEMGFEYLPFRKSDVAGVLSAAVSPGKTRSDAPDDHAAEKAADYIEDKDAALAELRDEMGDCVRCKLCQGRKNIVYGEGNADADLMFIGEAPGRDEDIQGRPFVGDAGKLLTNLIVKLGLKREDVYITNIVKCRPPSNRNPEAEEIETCRPVVERQIEIIGPRVIVCLGKVAAQALLRVNTPISKLRGNFHNYRDIPVMPTYHPAYLLRNPKDKWRTWDDMQKVMARIRE